MESYNVETTETALNEAFAYVEYIRKQSQDNLPAETWLTGLLSAIETLSTFPARCPLIPEKSSHDLPVHQLLYGSHRIMFTIEEGLVTVLRVYHASRRALKRPSVKAHRSGTKRTSRPDKL